MPEFVNLSFLLSMDRKLKKEELVRAIRFFISAEYEAIQIYTQVAEATDDLLAKKVLYDIANEERVHAGEFLKLLKEIEKDEENYYKDGEKEVEEMKEDLSKK
ncbi:MAG: rubrerythrin [Dictyoglomus sp. NZ13-RE01]|nr:MAG: rubrerythrin [Dictyoglomus sp. NZ13-RE01]